MSRLFLSGICLAGLLCGCSRGLDIVAVSGRVMHPDGAPIKANDIRLVFIPLDSPGEKQRSGSAVVDPESGRFLRVSTFAAGDGLLRGRHRVVIRCLGPREEPLQVIPAEYSSPDDSPLTIDTSDGYIVITVPRA